MASSMEMIMVMFILRALQDWNNRKANSVRNKVIKDITAVFNEVLSLVISIVANILLIYAIERNQPHYMIPWLVVYFIGILSLFIGTTMLMMSKEPLTSALVPSVMGLVFSILWFTTRSLFKDVKMDIMLRTHEIEMNSV